MNLNFACTSEVWSSVTSHVNALGESPFWHPYEQRLYWLDISGKQILRANIDEGTVETWNMPSEPGCIAPAAKGGLVIALRHGVFRASQWGAPLQPLATLDYDPEHMRANDGKCDALGRFWVGTMDETRHKHNAALYCIDARLGGIPQVTCKIRPADLHATTANGLAWSPDGGSLYWADTSSHTVWTWRYDAFANQMSQQRVFAQCKPKPEGWQANSADLFNGGYGGRPDGAAVDSKGNYWVAMYEGRRVCQFSPDGAMLAEFAVPLQCPTMPCFGGVDLKTLYLTSARQHCPLTELMALPLSGAVLSMRVETPGLPVNFFVD
jgi:sugar lactone lactonase YvrE